jgi:nucleoside-diphosphate-sugar epimerase
MAYLVTGATGFIGRHLVEELLDHRTGPSTRWCGRACETEQIMLTKVLKGVHW